MHFPLFFRHLGRQTKLHTAHAIWNSNKNVSVCGVNAICGGGQNWITAIVVAVAPVVVLRGLAESIASEPHQIIHHTTARFWPTQTGAA